MDFNDEARLDTSQVNDRRGGGGFGRGRGGGFGGGGFGGGGFGPGLGGGRGRRGAAIGGGGGLGALVLLGILFFSGAFGGGDGGGSGDRGPTGSAPRTGSGPLTGAGGLSDEQLRRGGTTNTTDLATECRTGADADRSERCRVVALVNSVQRYWASSFSSSQRPYRQAQTILFSGRTQTGCGGATSAVGPFYCPADQKIYIDLTFFDELQSSYGANGGPFAQAYVIAHEYGHHVQNLTGVSSRVQRSGNQSGPQSPAVRLELQADCYAGTWAANAQRSGFVTFTEADIRDGLSAASAVGDDRIQEKSQGRVTPESWTHGSAEQRTMWFLTGLRGGSPGVCDTFSGNL